METESPGARPAQDRSRRAYWRANLRLIAALLAVWALVSYGFGIVLVEPLNRFQLGGFPLGFWFAQQGAIYTFVVLIAVYAVAMDRIDRRYGVDDDGMARAAARRASRPEDAR
jgi:putative solute:sodium symporter small subunit